MGVYIKGMKMPKECGECPLYSSIDDVCQFDQTDTCYDEKRPWWCPLVEVPEPHGDLIDRDALVKEMTNGIRAGNLEEGYEEYQNINNMDDCVDCVSCADAVIEAEGE